MEVRDMATPRKFHYEKNKEKPRIVKKYLLAALFNAPSTMDAFYQAEVNHDQAYGACEA